MKNTSSVILITFVLSMSYSVSVRWLFIFSVAIEQTCSQKIEVFIVAFANLCNLVVR